MIDDEMDFDQIMLEYAATMVLCKILGERLGMSDESLDEMREEILESDMMDFFDPSESMPEAS